MGAPAPSDTVMRSLPRKRHRLVCVRLLHRLALPGMHDQGLGRYLPVTGSEFGIGRPD